jgi:hypothetical protein
MEVQDVVLAAIRSQLDGLKKNIRKTQVAKLAASKNAVKKSGDEEELVEVTPAASATAFLSLVPLAQISPQSFYLELSVTRLEAPKIPGEQRIPLEAISSAHAFFGWRENYIESRNPRRGSSKGTRDTVYYNWYPIWRVYPASKPQSAVEKVVRMYFYVNSSDFRFYSSEIANNATSGDIVRIRRVADERVDYDCAIAFQGTQEHTEWKEHCKETTARSPRMFGFS